MDVRHPMSALYSFCIKNITYDKIYFKGFFACDKLSVVNRILIHPWKS